MRKGNLTREEVIELVGLALVEKLEAEECDFTNRLQTDGDEAVEFAASVNFTDSDGMPRALTAYYYQDQDDIDEAGDDLGGLNWEINGYEIW
jgi:hypothetical protein